MLGKRTSFSAWAVFVLASLLALGLFAPVAAAQSLREQLESLQAQIQQYPDDVALREKIINVARQMSPPPEIPPEARSHFDRGMSLQENAGDLDQVDASIQEFRQALLLAPWWPQAYNHLAAAYETVGDYDNAIINLKLYLLTHPGPADARDARQRLAELGVSPEASEPGESTPPAVSDRYSYLLGQWQWGYYYSSYRGAGTGTGKRTGNLIQIDSHIPGHERFLRGTIKSSGEIAWEYWTGDYPGGPGFCPRNYGWQPVELQISPDQRVIRFQYVFSPIGHCDILATEVPIVYTLIKR